MPKPALRIFIGTALAGAMMQVPAYAQNDRTVSQPGPQTSSMQPEAPGSCPAVDPSGNIVILSMYGGAGPRPTYALRGMESSLSTVKVSGDEGKREKITLALFAYEATVWDLSDIKDRVTGVMVYGHHAQAISGLPKSKPAIFQIMNAPEGLRAHHPSECFPQIVHEDLYKVQRQAKNLQSILGGDHPRRWYGGYKVTSFSVDGGTVKAPGLVPKSSLRSNMEVTTNTLLPGNEGLEQLVQSGHLRRISKKDVNAWAAQGGELNPIAGPGIRLMGSHDPIEHLGFAKSGYLVLKDLPGAPAGLGGANSVIFILPEDISMPMEAGHSTIYRLSNYPGKIPPPGELVPIDHRSQTIRVGDGRYSSPNQYVEWDANGKITKHGMLQQQIPTVVPSSEDESSSSEDSEESDKGSLWPIALGIALAFLAAAGALILWLRRPRTKPVVEDEHPAELRKLLDDLDRLIEASEEDATALSISRFKRLLIKAVHEADFDEDLAQELDKIALVHIPNYAKSFLSAVKLGRDDDLETKLRKTIDMMSTKIEEIVAEQRSRYRDSFNVQDGFVKARHE